MQLLSIFHTGGVTLMLTIVLLGLAGWFFYQAYRGHNSGTITPATTTTPEKYDPNDKRPYWKLPTFWLGVACLIIYVLCLLLVASDYKGV